MALVLWGGGREGGRGEKDFQRCDISRQKRVHATPPPSLPPSLLPSLTPSLPPSPSPPQSAAIVEDRNFHLCPGKARPIRV